LIINEILVEATGVELFRVLITRNLLILGTATTAKKAPLPDPLYVYCTKILSLWRPAHHIPTTVSHRFAGMDREKHAAFYNAARSISDIFISFLGACARSRIDGHFCRKTHLAFLFAGIVGAKPSVGKPPIEKV
jgi:hypothetical protein